MIEKEFITRLAEEHLADSTCYLVEVAVRPGNLIVIEIDHDEAVGIDDCVALSHYIESHLDRETEDFGLEVGSVGLTSPYKLVRQYIKSVGNEVEVLLKKGEKKSGILKSADENEIVVTIEKRVKLEGAKRKTTVQEDVTFTYDEILHTKNIIRFN